MRKFSIQIYEILTIWYNHYLSDKFIKKEGFYDYFKGKYPLRYWSRGSDEPAIKYKSGACIWYLDDRLHRVGKPACIWFDGRVLYYENGEKVK